jgi:predicted transcriptional regulator
MFEQLKKMSGADNLEKVVSNYISSEEEMFSHYNFIQETNAEIDSIAETRTNIEADIKAYEESQSLQKNQIRHRCFVL